MSRDKEYLADLIRSGDPDTIVRELYPVARRMVAGVLRVSDPHLLDTATHDALLAVCRYRYTFRGESQVTTWLYTVARRAALRTVKHFRSLESSVLDPRPLSERALGGWVGCVRPDPEARIAARELLGQLVPNPDWRRIWLLWNEPGCLRTHGDVARLTGYTEGSIAATLSKVRRQIAGGV